MRASLKALGLAVALAVAAASCSGGYDSKITAPPGGTTGGNTGGNTTGTTGPAVAISGFAFAPVSLTVQSGATVEWTNKDATAHTVTADDASFGSANLGNGGTYAVTFSKAGTYSYHCAIHPSMTGTIVVQ